MEFEILGNKDTRSGFGEGLAELGRTNPDVVALCADLTGSLKMDEFKKENPERFFQVGIAEANMMGMAAGIASTGKRVFVYSIGNFPTLRCLEQIRNDVCLMNNPVVIVSVGAGYSYGSQGYTHHALEDCRRQIDLVQATLRHLNVKELS
jgi:transketolase